MAIIGSRKTWQVDNQNVRAGKGPLIRVRRPNGSTVKMYEADAVAAGLIPAPKQAPAPENKLRPPEADKAPAPAPQPEPADDLTEVDGIGPASARLLAAEGITTFALLRTADLGPLSIGPKLKQAIEAWRNSPNEPGDPG